MRVATELSELKSELERINHEVQDLRKRIRNLQEQENEDTPSLAKARGIWKGADFTEEEIEAAKIRVKDID